MRGLEVEFCFLFTSFHYINPSIGSDPTPLSTSLPAVTQEGWSKQNLKSGERRAWTRGRDGWSPVIGCNTSNVGGASTGLGIVEGTGEIRFVP